MIELGPARESDIVLAFLRAEIDSPQYCERIQNVLQTVGVTRQQLIDDADLNSDCCNALRRVVLESYRGYLSKSALFAGFPRAVTWRRVELEETDLNRLRYLNYPEWVSHSEETRLPRRVADRIARGELRDLAKKVIGIQERLKRGETLLELVAVEGNEDDLILIEGANRSTAYVGLQWKMNVRAFIGRSPLMRNWQFF
jgi:hypothetical protein